MFSALKRLTGKTDGGTSAGVAGTPGPRPGLQAMSHSLQRKFARGVQYNMKIIIKGDRNVGKTCLFHRLQGGKFVEEYIPTEEIQVASIQWSYKATEDVVKVEVWDVVDHGRKRRQLKGLKLGSDCGGEDGKADGEKDDPEEMAALDAQFLDVYKGTNGVVLMMDVTKSWTFDYVVRELPKIPHHIPVLVLANHCDMGHHRTVTADTVTYFIEGLNRSPESIVRYAESSMRNGFGLRLLHRFLNVPFLRLQRDTLEAQLATNARETELTIAELDLYQSSDEADYDKFLENLTSRRRAAAENTGIPSSSFSSYAPGSVGPNGATPAPQSAHQVPSSLHSSQSSHVLSSVPSSNSSAIPSAGAQTWKGQQMPRPEPLGAMKKSSSVPGPNTASLMGLASPSSSSVSPCPKATDSRPATGPGKPDSQIKSLQSSGGRNGETDVSYPADLPKGTAVGNNGHGSIMSKLFRKTSKDLGAPEGMADLKSEKPHSVADPISSVDEFVPDGGMIDRSFLEDDNRQPIHVPLAVERESEDEDSDADKGNPLVAGFQDDLDSDNEYLGINQSSRNVLPLYADTKSGGNGSSPALSDEENERPLSVASGREGCAGRKGPYESHLLDSSMFPPPAFEEFLSSAPVKNIDSFRWSKKNGPSDGDAEDSFIKENNVSSDESATIPSLDMKASATKDKTKKKKEKGDEKSSKKHKKTKKKKEKDASGEKIERRKKKHGSDRRVIGERDDELEEFLNGSPASLAPEAYEAI